MNINKNARPRPHPIVTTSINYKYQAVLPLRVCRQIADCRYSSHHHNWCCKKKKAEKSGFGFSHSAIAIVEKLWSKLRQSSENYRIVYTGNANWCCNALHLVVDNKSSGQRKKYITHTETQTQRDGRCVQGAHSTQSLCMSHKGAGIHWQADQKNFVRQKYLFIFCVCFLLVNLFIVLGIIRRNITFGCTLVIIVFFFVTFFSCVVFGSASYLSCI